MASPPNMPPKPAHMYLEAFRYVLSQPELALALTGTFVILSQVKINVTNAYAGSIAVVEISFPASPIAIPVAWYGWSSTCSSRCC